MQGRVNDALVELHALLQSNPHDGSAHLLLCRAFLSEELTEEAVSECQSAAASEPSSSDAQDWLGRAYGLKADRSGPFSGFSLARKVRDAFEAAVRLNPRNPDAFDDLGEYYVEAPGLVGGGMDKATELATQAKSILPERAQILRAMIAEHGRDFGTAEREFRMAAQDSGRPDTWVDLARYYGRQHMTDQAITAIRHAVAIDRDRDASLAHAAEALIKLKVEPQLAIQALRAYLSGPALSDAAPACKVHTELGKLLKATGDRATAKMEFQRALALASGYAPAKKELAAL